MTAQPLRSVSSEQIRELETQIVHDSVESAVGAARNLDVGEYFRSDIVGISAHPEFFARSVHAKLVANIEEQLKPLGLRLEHEYGTSCDFIVHAKQS